MDAEIYTEDVLQGKKYGELIKIVKSLGLKATNRSGRMLKTAKLIEVILETQSANHTTEDTSAVGNTLGSINTTSNDEVQAATEKHEPVGELLTDIQFLEDLEPNDCDSSSKTKRRRTSTYEVLPSESPSEMPINDGQRICESSKDQKRSSVKDKMDGVSNKRGRPKHTRSETFELDDKGERSGTEVSDVKDVSDDSLRKAKRRRTSTYEVLDNESICKSSPGDNHHSSAEENAQQLFALAKRLSEKQSLQGITESTLPTPKPDSSTQKALSTLSSKEKRIKKISQTLREMRRSSLTPARKIPKERDTGKTFSSKRISHTMSRKSNAAPVKELSSKTPKSSKKESPASKIMKPLFTVGKNGNSVSAKEKQESILAGSNIPRFVTYARKMKMPNFAKIHEKAFERMQALDDYVERRRNVSGLTSSSRKGAKPT
ncbi:hypothetical protein SK128_028393, partial [Halocaridina rubra]